MRLNNKYTWLDGMLNEYARMKEKALQQGPLLLMASTSQVAYSTPSMYLGLCSASLLTTDTEGFSVKRTRMLRAPGKRKNYIRYEYDNAHRVNCLYHIQNEKMEYIDVILRDDTTEWVIPLTKSENGYCHYPYYGFMIERLPNEQVKYFAYMDGLAIWCESYRYSTEYAQEIICEKWYYVPQRKGSHPVIPVQRTGSPADLWRYRLIKEGGKIVRCELIESYTHDNIAVHRMEVVPQLHYVGKHLQKYRYSHC